MEEVPLEGGLVTGGGSSIDKPTDLLIDEVEGFRLVIGALSQIERRCSEYFKQLEGAATQVCRENERLRADLARLGGAAPAERGGGRGGGAEAGGAVVKALEPRVPSRNGWMQQEEPLDLPASVPSPRGAAPKLLPGAVDSDEEQAPRPSPKPSPRLSRGASRASLVSSKGSGSTVSTKWASAGRTKGEEPKGMATGQNPSPSRHVVAPSGPVAMRGSRRSPQFFPDVDGMKANAVKALILPGYDVRERYSATGIPQAVVGSATYECCRLALIAFSVLWLSVEAEHNAGQELYQSPAMYQVVEHGLCLLFCLDLLVRMLAFRKKRETLYDPGFRIDLGLVIVMTFETWLLPLVFWVGDVDTSSPKVSGVSLIRLIRVLRLARLVRLSELLWLVPSVPVLAQGVAATAWALCVGLSLLFLVVYTAAIFFAQTAGDMRVGQVHFGSMVDSMVTLAVRGTMPNLANLIYEIGRESRLLAACFVLFGLLTFLAALYLLLGLAVHVASGVACMEKERSRAELVRTRLLAMLRGSGRGVMGSLGRGGGMPVPMVKREFEALLQEPKAHRAFQELGVDAAALLDAVRSRLDDKRQLPFPELLSLCLSVQGGNAATVRDLAEVRHHVAEQLGEKVSAFAQELKVSVSLLQKQLAELPKELPRASAGGDGWTDGKNPGIAAALARASAAGGPPQRRMGRTASTGARGRSRSSTWQGTPASGYVQGTIGDRLQMTPRSGRRVSTASADMLRTPARSASGSPPPSNRNRWVNGGPLMMHTVV